MGENGRLAILAASLGWTARLRTRTILPSTQDLNLAPVIPVKKLPALFLGVVLLGLGTGVAVFVAFGGFLCRNVLIRSDYLWFVGVLFVIAVLASLSFPLSLLRPLGGAHHEERG